MPTCDVCHLFYIRPQTFENLFSHRGICVICETYAGLELRCETIPIEGDVMEFYSFDAVDHPMLTKRIFECAFTFVFYEPDWKHREEVFHLMSALFSPFRMFHYSRCVEAYMRSLSTSP